MVFNVGLTFTCLSSISSGTLTLAIVQAPALVLAGELGLSVARVMQGQHVHRMLVWDQHLGVREMAGAEHAAQPPRDVKAQTLTASAGPAFIETRGKILHH